MKNMVKAALTVIMIICLIAVVMPATAINYKITGVNATHSSPARIELKAERSHVTADNLDNIRITAYVYDTQGNLVADGYNVNFTIGNATSNSFMSGWDFNYAPGAQGSLNSPDNFNNFYQSATRDNSGCASVQFGWIDEYYSGNNSTIWAYDADNASIFASTKIYSSAPMASWAGYAVDSSGAGLGGINVKMHVMGYYQNGTPYEIYNMTRTTSSSQQFVGRFTFDYIVLQGASYGYVDAEARLTDNLTIYGKSSNVSMNRSDTSIGPIVMKASPDAIKVTAAASPSATVKPTPGFEALFELMGFGVAYLIARKKN